MSGVRWCVGVRVLGRVACGTFFIALMLLAPASARAVNPPIVVTNCFDSGLGSLRAAIGAATAGDTITFSANLNCTSASNGPIILTSGTLALNQNVTIDGTGATITVDGGCITNAGGVCVERGVTVFTVNGGVNATLNALTIQHGFTALRNGGGIANAGALTVTNSTLVANASAGSAGSGGGIFNDINGTVTVTNSTFSGNSAAGAGGGIANANGQPLTVTNSTFSGNSAGNSNGGGIFTGGPATLTNTLVAASPTGGDLVAYSPSGGAFTGSNNLIDDAASAGGFTDRAAGNIVGHPALLGPLGSYGGPTQTFALLPGSSAIDAGTATGAPATDQRGKPRVNAPDIGAFESQGFTLAKTSGDSQSALVGTQFGQPLVVTVTANNSVEPVAGGVITFTGPTSGAGIQNSPLTAPITGTTASVTATANLMAGTGYPVQASATGATAVSFTLTNTPPTITLVPPTLPGGTKGIAYPSQTLTASGGAAPYTFAVTSGALPGGLTLTSAGILSGTPTATGTVSFTVTATDHNGFTGTQPYSITITAAPLVSITIAPAGGGAPTVKVGQSVQFVATGTYADGSVQQLPAVQVTWSGDNAQVATVDPTTGTVTGESPGTIHLTATDGNVTQTITVTIGAPTPIGIVVAPAPANRPGGASAAGSGAPTPAPAPSVPARGGSGSGSAPAPLPPGR